MDEHVPEIRTLDLIDNSFYCLCINYNCILSISLDDFCVEYLGALEQEYTFQRLLSLRSSVYGNRILYCPHYARNIHSFDVEKRRDTIISNSTDSDVIRDVYWGFLKEDDIYYAIPRDGGNILEIDVNRGEIIRAIDIFGKLRKKGLNYYIGDFTESDGYRYKDKFYISMKKNPFIIELDFRNDNYQAYKIEGLDMGSGGVAGIENLLYIYNKEHYVVTYDIEGKRVMNKVKIPIEENTFFDTTLVIKHEIFFYNRFMAVKYNTITNDFTVINFNDKFAGEDTYKLVGEMEDSKMVFVSGLKKMVVLDLENDTYKRYELKCNMDELRKKIVKNIYFPNDCIYEYTDLALPNYITNNTHNNINITNNK